MAAHFASNTLGVILLRKATEGELAQDNVTPSKGCPSPFAHLAMQIGGAGSMIVSILSLSWKLVSYIEIIQLVRITSESLQRIIFTFTERVSISLQRFSHITISFYVIVGIIFILRIRDKFLPLTSGRFYDWVHAVPPSISDVHTSDSFRDSFGY